MNGEKGVVCMQLFTFNAYRLRWKIQEHIPISDSCLSYFAHLCQGETQKPISGSPDFIGRNLSAWGRRKPERPGGLKPTGNSPKPFGLEPASLQPTDKSEVRKPDPVQVAQRKRFCFKRPGKKNPLVWG